MKKILILIMAAVAGTAAMCAATDGVRAATDGGDKTRVTIFGDSYSTFEGYIPSTHEPWYAPEGSPFCKAPNNDVTKPEQTW